MWTGNVSTTRSAARNSEARSIIAFRVGRGPPFESDRSSFNSEKSTRAGLWLAERQENPVETTLEAYFLVFSPSKYRLQVMSFRLTPPLLKFVHPFRWNFMEWKNNIMTNWVASYAFRSLKSI
jgi:hypothetical protein